MSSFSAQVSDWVRDVKGAAEAIAKQSAQDVVNEAQKPVAAGGRMRVDTGFLRASLTGSNTAMPQINRAAKPAEGGVYAPEDAQIIATISAYELGETMYFGYTASYAAFREFGANGQPPDAFVRTAAQKWPDIVKRNETELKGRIG